MQGNVSSSLLRCCGFCLLAICAHDAFVVYGQQNQTQSPLPYVVPEEQRVVQASGHSVFTAKIAFPRREDSRDGMEVVPPFAQVKQRAPQAELLRTEADGLLIVVDESGLENLAKAVFHLSGKE